jgi:hypothetical protein
VKNPCEDYGYEMQRQERIDAMTQFGQGLPKAQRMPQKIERRDPWPHIPWAHYGPQPMSWWGKLFWALYCIAIGAFVIWGRWG